MINVCLAGTGGTIPLKDRWLTCLYLEYKGRSALVDCGEGTQIALTKGNCKLAKIEVILITHVHADHIAGLPGLLLTMGNHGRTEPVTVYAPIGTRYIIGNLCSICPFIPFQLNVIELDIDTISMLRWNELVINVLPLRHTLPCLGYSFELERLPVFDPAKATALGIPKDRWSFIHKCGEVEFQGKTYTRDMVTGEAKPSIKVTYMTDTMYFDDMVDFAKNSDLLVCEGMYGDSQKEDKAAEKGHMFFTQSAAVARDSASKELWLTHYSPSLDNPKDYEGQVREVFENTIISVDGQCKDLH